MAIFKENIVKDIYGMIRKGSVQFEPGDRIPMTIRQREGDITLLIGGVHYDDTVFDACYDLYTSDHKPVNTSQPMRVSNLTPDTLCDLGAVLERYNELAIQRYGNYQSIESALAEAPGSSITFSEEGRPYVLARLDGGFHECRAESVFIDRNGECLVGIRVPLPRKIDEMTGDLHDGMKTQYGISNQKLSMLNDKSIMNLASCVKMLKHSKRINVDRSEKTSAGTTLK